MIYFCTMATCALLIVIGVVFGTVKPNADERDRMRYTTCTSIALVSTSSKCCRTSNCVCQECAAVGKYPCDQVANYNATGQFGTCCSSSCCQQTCCDTCCRQVCSGSGKDRVCRIVCSKCRCTCCAPIVQSTCQYQCGICKSWILLFQYVVNQNVSVQDRVYKCGQDDSDCNNNLIQKYHVNATWDCYYDPSNPSYVRFDSIPPWNILALVAVGLFGFLVVLGYGCCVTIGFCTCTRKKIQNQNENAKQASEKLLDVAVPVYSDQVTSSDFMTTPSAPPLNDAATNVDAPPPYQEPVTID